MELASSLRQDIGKVSRVHCGSICVLSDCKIVQRTCRSRRNAIFPQLGCVGDAAAFVLEQVSISWYRWHPSETFVERVIAPHQSEELKSSPEGLVAQPMGVLERMLRMSQHPRLHSEKV